MKQLLIPKLDTKQTTKFNNVRNQSLKILACNYDELKRYLSDQTNINPYLNYEATNNEDIDADAFLEYDYEKKTLFDEIMEQVKFCEYDVNEEICEYLIAQLDSNGYFKTNYKQLIEQSPYSKDEIKKQISILRTFEPYGLFAFDLCDCLKIQCKLSKDTNKENAFILCNHLEELALNRFDEVQAKTNLSIDDIHDGFTLIQSFNPKPGANFNYEVSYMSPEFKISVEDENISIALLNDDLTLHLNISDTVSDSSDISEEMKKQRLQAQNIMNSVQKRNMTLMQIMQIICDVQKDFFLNGGNVHHLTLAMISERTGLHTSTISRALSNKSFEFNLKYYPLKDMLSSGGSASLSNSEIKAKIIEIIDNEDKSKPYSDEAIRDILGQNNIHISRRAVSKYREFSLIFNSAKRKIK